MFINDEIPYYPRFDDTNILRLPRFSSQGRVIDITAILALILPSLTESRQSFDSAFTGHYQDIFGQGETELSYV
jgi:hypothetical protein